MISFPIRGARFSRPHLERLAPRLNWNAIYCYLPNLMSMREYHIITAIHIRTLMYWKITENFKNKRRK